MTLTKPVTYRVGLLVSLFLGSFMALLDVSVVSVALPAMQRTFHTGFSELQWIIDGYTVALAAVILTSGTLGDRYGRKRMYLGGLALFTLASLACALAPTLGLFVAARVVQGTAAAAVVPGALALIAHSFPDPRERAQVMGWWSAVIAVSFVTGPLLGGPLTDAFGWPTIFLLNLPLGVLAVALGLRHIDESADPAHGGLDLPGQLLGVVWIGLLTYGVIEAGHLGWGSPRVLVPVAVALLALAAFVVVELRVEHPMLPIRMFAGGAFAAGNVASFVLGFASYPTLFFVGLYLEQSRGVSATAAGLQMLPFVAGNVVASFNAGRWSTRFGTSVTVPLGYLIAAAGAGGFLLLDAHSPYWLLAVVFALCGAGAGMSVTPTNLVVLAEVPRERSGMAAATVNMTRQTGLALGVAVLGALIALRPDLVSGLHLAMGVAGAALLAVTVLTAATLRAAD